MIIWERFFQNYFDVIIFLVLIHINRNKFCKSFWSIFLLFQKGMAKQQYFILGDLSVILWLFQQGEAEQQYLILSDLSVSRKLAVRRLEFFHF